jgi:hypothetical protein
MSELTESLSRRIRERNLPPALFAVVGAADMAAQRATESLEAVARAPQRLIKHSVSEVQSTFDSLVDRGHGRIIEISADRAVRARFAKVEDRWAPRAADAAVRYNDRLQRFKASPTRRRAAKAAARTRRAREAARRSAERFAKMNAPVLIEEDAPPGPPTAPERG